MKNIKEITKYILVFAFIITSVLLIEFNSDIPMQVQAKEKIKEEKVKIKKEKNNSIKKEKQDIENK